MPYVPSNCEDVALGSIDLNDKVTMRRIKTIGLVGQGSLFEGQLFRVLATGTNNISDFRNDRVRIDCVVARRG